MRSLPAVFLLILCFFLTLMPVARADAAILRVPADHATVGKALAAAGSGDMVRVAQGTYYEHINLKPGVTLEGGWNADFSKRDVTAFATVLDGEKEKGPVVKGADNAVIDGFTIQHGSLLKTADISEGAGVHCRGVSPIIRNNIVRENEPSGIYCDNSKATIIDNRIYNNAQAGVYMLKGSSLKIIGNNIYSNKYSGIGCGKEPISEFEITRNIIHENERSGINAETGIGVIRNNLLYDNKRAGIRTLPMPVTIINNTVVGSGWTGVLIEDPSAVATIKNNIIVGNVDTGIRTRGKGYTHNLLFANGETGSCDPKYLWCVKPQFGGYEDEESYKKTRNIIADPLFVDARGHDYHLKAGSPAIDAGDKKPEFNDAHLPPSLGGPRNDMGCYGGPYTLAEERKGNRAPVARSVEEIEAVVGRRSVLDGTGSLDPDGDALSYQWTLVAKPEGSKARLRRAERVKTAFKADVPGRYEAQLVVTDSLGKTSKPQIVVITVPANTRPEAHIGEVLTQVSTGDTLTFYGNSSKDPEGNPLTYTWTLLFKPAESRIALACGNEDSCSFQVDVDGSYTIQLVVNDGELDSEPVSVNVSTGNGATAGIRRVPQEYPTIQSALDAAAPGDDIVVDGGHYEELIVIDKSVNLIGKGWPVIDGGSQKGNKNTISIFYLGDRAGRIEGFVITGGGTGDLGHGINIWDSAPDIFNNRITGNIHGMGIHGSPSLTGKTRVHSNLIYGNQVGIGNGKDSYARIYNNRVFHNRVAGIGARGKSRPRIENNYIYSNRIGIGAREVASPLIQGNHIFDNTDGLIISPLSTIKKFSFEDIRIENNLIVKNQHLGINITSFNLSKVIINGNTIDGNNYGKRKIRGGGIILGYPQPATFTVQVAGNLISNNHGGGLVRYIGPETFPEPGADLINEHNNLWNNTTNYVDCMAGANALSVAPPFDGKVGEGIEGYLEQAGEVGYHYDAARFAELPDEPAEESAL